MKIGQFQRRYQSTDLEVCKYGRYHKYCKEQCKSEVNPLYSLYTQLHICNRDV